MEKTLRILNLFYFVPIVVSLLIVICFETGIILQGDLYLIGGDTCEFVVLMVMELLTICVIPVSLRLFKVKKIKKELPNSPENLLHYGKWRLLLLMVPLVLNTLFYYLFVSVPFGYLAIILLLVSFFVFPSASRCKNEIATETNEK